MAGCCSLPFCPFLSSFSISPFLTLCTCYLSFSFFSPFVALPPPFLLPLPGIEEEWLLNDCWLDDWMAQLTFSHQYYTVEGGSHTDLPLQHYVLCAAIVVGCLLLIILCWLLRDVVVVMDPLQSLLVVPVCTVLCVCVCVYWTMSVVSCHTM